MIESFAKQNEAKPTILDLINQIKTVAPPSEHAFIEQQFSSVLLHSIKVQHASYDAEKSTINISVNASKIMVDSHNEHIQANFDDLVDVYVFSTNPNNHSTHTEVLYRKKHRLVEGVNNIVITLDKNSMKQLLKQSFSTTEDVRINDDTAYTPRFVGVDPYVRFIDTDSKDNIVKL